MALIRKKENTLCKQTTGIPQCMLLMWDTNKKPQKQKPRKSRLLSSTKGEEKRIES